VASFLKCFDPGCRREPTVRQSRSVYIVRTNQHDSPYQNGVNALVSHLIYQPHSVCSVRKCIYKATVGVRLINQSATVVWNGMQSHCGTLASNTKRYSPGDVASKFLLATRAISTGCCARFLRGETCCSIFGYIPILEYDALHRRTYRVEQNRGPTGMVVVVQFTITVPEST
jgi:hypothetical protein